MSTKESIEEQLQAQAAANFYLMSKLEEVNPSAADAIARAEAAEAKLAEVEAERDGFKAAWQNACERGDRAVARLAEAERLIGELCAHEGAEGFSEDLNRDLERFYAQRPTDSADDRETVKP